MQALPEAANSEVPAHEEFPNRCHNALERGNKSSPAVLSPCIAVERAQPSNAGRRGQDSGAWTAMSVAFQEPYGNPDVCVGGRYDLGGHMIPMIS